MPEAFACLFVGLVSVGIFLYAKVQAFTPQSNRAADEKARVQSEITWLEQRLELANREGWHDDMREPIEERLAEARKQAARFGAE